MKDASSLQAGQLVYSRAGRDKGKPYLVLARAGETEVWIVDGAARRVEAPKKKNVKHLQPSHIVCGAMQNEMRSGKLPQNGGIRLFLKPYEKPCACNSACPCGA